MVFPNRNPGVSEFGIYKLYIMLTGLYLRDFEEIVLKKGVHHADRVVFKTLVNLLYKVV